MRARWRSVTRQHAAHTGGSATLKIVWHCHSTPVHTLMNVEQARFNMVEQQVRPWDVLDARILDLLFEVRREDFVPPAWRTLAFSDLEIPLGHDAVMLSPKMEARMLQELDLHAAGHALEIGTGSGYVAALMGRLAHQVTSVEIVPELAASAAARLHSLGCDNVDVMVGDGARDWPQRSDWDAILVSGALPTQPDGLLSRLAPGGRLLAVIGDAPVMRAILWQRTGAGFQHTVLFETQIPSLRNASQPERFTF